MTSKSQPRKMRGFPSVNRDLERDLPCSVAMQNADEAALRRSLAWISAGTRGRARPGMTLAPPSRGHRWCFSTPSRCAPRYGAPCYRSSRVSTKCSRWTSRVTTAATRCRRASSTRWRQVSICWKPSSIRLGIRQAHIVGNSLGGWFAIELARRQRALSVVALAPGGGWQMGSREHRRLVRRMHLARALVQLGGPAAGILGRFSLLRRMTLGYTVARPESTYPGRRPHVHSRGLALHQLLWGGGLHVLASPRSNRSTCPARCASCGGVPTACCPCATTPIAGGERCPRQIGSC